MLSPSRPRPARLAACSREIESSAGSTRQVAPPPIGIPANNNASLRAGCGSPWSGRNRLQFNGLRVTGVLVGSLDARAGRDESCHLPVSGASDVRLWLLERWSLVRSARASRSLSGIARLEVAGSREQRSQLRNGSGDRRGPCFGSRWTTDGWKGRQCVDLPEPPATWAGKEDHLSSWRKVFHRRATRAGAR